MERRKLFLFMIFLCASIILSAQNNYYWSAGKKHFLKENSTVMIVRFTEKESFKNIKQKLEGDQIIRHISRMGEGLGKVFSREGTVLSVQELMLYEEFVNAMPSYQLGNLPFYLTGEILLQPKTDISIERILKLIDNRAEITRHTKYNTFVLETDDWIKILNYSNKIYESGLAEYCHPNFIAPVELSQTDPLYQYQYYLNNTGQYGGTVGIDINAPEAWNITTGLCNVKVAVIDDGVENHDDFDGRVLQGFTPKFSEDNPDTHGAPNANDPRETDYPGDKEFFGHGVCCTGIIAASHNNGKGIRGVAPAVGIIPVNLWNDWVIEPEPDYEEFDSIVRFNETALDFAMAIDFAWDSAQADVISNSWTYRGNPSGWSDSDEIIYAIGRARNQGRGGLGTIVVFSSGNDKYLQDVRFPADVDGVITVGAIDNNGNIHDYSCRGPEMDLVCPSGKLFPYGNVHTTDRMGIKGYREYSNYYSGFGGTSAACPQVSGVAALLLSVYPNLSEYQIRTILQQTATDMGATGFDNTYGYGRLNASYALELACPYSITGPSLVCTSDEQFTLYDFPPGKTINWTVIPASYMAEPSSGSGSTANFHATCSAIGETQITFTISDECGSIQTGKNILIGGPDQNDVELDVYYSTGEQAPKYYVTWLLCPNTYYHIYLDNNSSCSTSGYQWTIPSAWTRMYTYQNMISVYTGSTPGGNVIVKAQTCCSGCGSDVTILSDYLGTYWNCGGYYFGMSPNPADDYVEISLDETKVDINNIIEYEVKIYNSLQVLVSDEKTSNPTLLFDTSHFQDGIYYVHLIYNGKPYVRQLVVSH